MMLLVIVLSIALWGSVYWPVYLIMREFFAGTRHADLKSSSIALFWPITIPFGLLFLMVVGRWR